MDGQQAMIWIQVGQAMVQMVISSVSQLKAMLAASGMSPAEQQAALDRVYALYEGRIAHEQAIVDAGDTRTDAGA